MLLIYVLNFSLGTNAQLPKVGLGPHISSYDYVWIDVVKSAL